MTAEFYSSSEDGRPWLNYSSCLMLETPKAHYQKGFFSYFNSQIQPKISKSLNFSSLLMLANSSNRNREKTQHWWLKQIILIQSEFDFFLVQKRLFVNKKHNVLLQASLQFKTETFQILHLPFSVSKPICGSKGTSGTFPVMTNYHQLHN